MGERRWLRLILSRGCAAFIAAVSLANSAHADSYKCQAENSVVRRDKPCQPGERTLEVLKTSDLRPAPPPKKSVAPRSAAEQAPIAIPPRPVAIDTPAVTTQEPAGPATEALRSISPALADPPQKQLEKFQSFLAYCQACAKDEFNADPCRDFWTWTVLSALLIVVLVLIKITMHMFRVQKALKEHQRWLAEQAKIADQETMKKHSWEGDAAIDVDLSQDDLAEEIRKAVKVKQGT